MTAPTANVAAAALSAIAAPTVDATADAMAQLADVAGHASSVLFNYRRDNPAATDVARALNLEMTLDQRAIDLRVRAVGLLGDHAAEALAQLKDAAQKVDGFLATVKRVEGGLAIANAVVSLTGAALVGDAGGILAAVVGVHTALKAVEA